MSALFGLLSFVFIVAGIFAAYWLLLRPVLRRYRMLSGAYDWLDAKEAGLLARARLLLSGLKTKLAARFVWLAGVLVAAHDLLLPYLTGVDLSPITSQIPPAYMLLILIGLGLGFDWLRSLTRTPPAA